MIKGLLVCIVGLIFLLFTEHSLKFLSIGSGLLIIIGGFILLAGAISHRRYNYEWTWWLMEALIDIVFGSVIIFCPLPLEIIALLIGVWVLIMGLMQIVTAINLQYYLRSNLIIIAMGILVSSFGAIIFMHPLPGIIGLIALAGVVSLIYGVTIIYLSFILRSVITEEIGGIEDLY